MREDKRPLRATLRQAVEWCATHRLPALILCLAVGAGSLAAGLPALPRQASADEMQAGPAEVSSAPEPTVEVSSQPAVSSAPTASAPAPAPAKKPAAAKPKRSAAVRVPTAAAATPATGDYRPNTILDPDNNLFLDALIYTGCNVAKRRAEGTLWQYVPASRKRALGYLSKIGYGGGSTGYETVGGKPNIAYFEKRGLVCASYLTYVYFNYLPNVAGIDVSSLTRPTSSVNADSWYNAARDWIRKGYSTAIPFRASGSIGGFLRFQAGDIPIGSVLAFENARKRNGHACHVGIYAGTKNGNHYMFHVGNDNGPEFCTIERVLFGPDPVWPLMVISTPSNIRWAARFEITLRDDTGAPVAGAAFRLRSAAGQEVPLGKTDANGRVAVEGLAYGKYTLWQLSAPQGYSFDAAPRTVELTTKQNSNNLLSLTNRKDPPPVSSQPESSAPESSVPGGSSSVPESSAPLSSAPESSAPDATSSAPAGPDDDTAHRTAPTFAEPAQ